MLHLKVVNKKYINKHHKAIMWQMAMATRILEGLSPLKLLRGRIPRVPRFQRLCEEGHETRHRL